MPLNTEDWNFILESLERNHIDENFITEIIEPKFSSRSLVSNFDNLGENFMFYSIVYQNKPLLNYLFQNVQYSSIPEKCQKKIKDSVYRGIKQLSYDCESFFAFLQELFHIIIQSSFKTILIGNHCCFIY